MTLPQTLLIEDRDAARLITIHRPTKLNALNEQVVDELLTAVNEAEHASGVRGIVITGAGGKAFVAGADIKAMAAMTREQALAFARQGHALADRLESLAIPVVAAVDGFALGGGCELALSCDFIYATEAARFGQPEVKLGVIPGFGGTQRLLRRVGQAWALELCMTGATIDASLALRLGLVNKVLPAETLVETALATVQTIAEQGPLAIAKVKQLVHRGASLPLGDANALEREAFADLFETADQREGMAAFLAKRPAAFKGA